LYLSGYAFKRFPFGNKKMETWGILSIKKSILKAINQKSQCSEAAKNIINNKKKEGVMEKLETEINVKRN
jgi:hypothetical protein